MAYRGSEFSEFGKDFLYTNAPQSRGYSTAQFKDAAEIAKMLGRRFHYPVHFTGHSLGGALATFSAIYSGSSAITFNPSAVHRKTLSGLEPGGAEITNYMSNFDILRVINTVTPGARLYGSRKYLGLAGTHRMAGMCRAVGCW